jgi:hypothetical protein
MRAPSKGRCTRNVFVLDSWSSAPVAYSPFRPKSQIFNIHDYALWIRNVMVLMKNPENLDFETWPNDPRPQSGPKVPKFKYDGILLIGNFMLMINNHFALFQLPGENVLSIFVATRNFLFISFSISTYTDVIGKTVEFENKQIWNSKNG